MYLMFSQKNKDKTPTNFIPLVWNWQLMNNLTTSDKLHDFDLNLMSKKVDMPESYYKIIGSKRVKGQTIRPIGEGFKSEVKLKKGDYYWIKSLEESDAPVFYLTQHLGDDRHLFINRPNGKLFFSKLLLHGYEIKKARYYPDQKLEPRIWSGKPYHSEQITFSSSLKVKEVIPIYFKWISKDHVRVTINQYKINIKYGVAASPQELIIIQKIAELDGFQSVKDLLDWFDKDFTGQIIVWDNYDFKNKMKKLLQ